MAFDTGKRTQHSAPLEVSSTHVPWWFVNRNCLWFQVRKSSGATSITFRMATGKFKAISCQRGKGLAPDRRLLIPKFIRYQLLQQTVEGKNKLIGLKKSFRWKPNRHDSKDKTELCESRARRVPVLITHNYWNILLRSMLSRDADLLCMVPPSELTTLKCFILHLRFHIALLSTQ